MVTGLVTYSVAGAVGLGVATAVWWRGLRILLDRPRLVAVLLASIALVLGLIARSPTLAVVVPIVTVPITSEIEAGRRRRHRQRRQAGLPVVVDHMIQNLRSGLGLRTVCTELVSVGPDTDEALRPLVDGLAAHRPLAKAIEDLQRSAAANGWFDVQLLAATLAAVNDRGSPAVDALQRLRLTLMGSIETAAKARSQAGQAQASAALLAGAPALFAGLIALADADIARFYLTEPIGTVCVVVALGLSYLGWRWMSRAVEQSLSNGGSSPSTGRRRRLIARRGDAGRRRQAALAPTIDLIAMTIGSGGTPAEGVAQVAERGPALVQTAFADVLEQQGRGHVLTDVLPSLIEDLGDDYHGLVTALVVSEQGGAPIGALLQRLADEATQARRRSVEMALARLPVRLLVPLVVCQLPAVIVGAVVPLTIVALRHLRG